MTPPSITIIMPTYNSGATIRLALDSIATQDYPSYLLGLLVPDAGSVDDTLEALRQFRNKTGIKTWRLDNGTLRTAEAGRSLAIEKATGDLLAFIDSDNILPGAGWFRRMAMPFADPEIVAAEPIEYLRRDCDGAITRYLAMMGMADPLNYWLGTYDRKCILGLDNPWVTWGSWGYVDGYFKVALAAGNIPTIGSNGYIARRSAILQTNYKPYQFDVETTRELIALGHNIIAKVEVGIVHLVSGSWRNFYRKQRRRARDYYYYRDAGYRRGHIGCRSEGFKGIVFFALSTITVLPLVYQVIRGYHPTRDRAWACHIPACWLTLIAYGYTVMRRWICGTEEPNREGWRQFK